MTETSPVHPISLYGQTKVDSERALLAARDTMFHPTILRYATVFGLGYRPRFDLVVNLLVARARQEREITIYNGQQWRPFIHVRDLVEATISVMEAPLRLVSGEIFNVGDSRENHTLAEVGEEVAKVFPGTGVVHVDNADRRNYRVSFQKIFTRLNFSARYTLRDGILELKRAFEEGLIEDYNDYRYNNQRFLKIVGRPNHKDEVDARIMAAFGSSQPTDGKIALAQAAS
jgi:nucleoside-diphosphate-sugar epimerase